MIDLPNFAVQGSASPTFMDAGFTQRGLQSLSRIDRKGSRYMLACTYGPFHPDQGRVMVARLIAGKQEGMILPFPLLHDQGSPGAPLVNGAVTTGRTVTLDTLTPGYFCKEGFWLSFEVAGQHYLHSIRTGGRANASGVLEVELNEMVRVELPDNTPVHLSKPMVQGFVQGNEWQWSISVDRVIPISFTIEEAA